MFTIIGVSAFQLLFILGLCFLAVSAPEVKKITNLPVFIVSSAFAVFAYLWLFIAVHVTTPGYISFPEALFTLVLYLLFILTLYILDTALALRSKSYFDRLILQLHNPLS